MDPIGAFLANVHALVGHEKAAAFLGVPDGGREHCLLCKYENARTPEAKQAVIDAIGTGRLPDDTSALDQIQVPLGEPMDERGGA